MAEKCLAEDQKNAEKSVKTVVLLDEIGFDLSPILHKTWSPIGETPVISEPVFRRHHSGLGMIFMSPKRTKFHFYFTIHPGAVLTEHLVFWLRELHRKVRKQVILVRDDLPGHRAAEAFFLAHHPTWFQFEHLPPYSPELNPTESPWSHIKTGDLANFVPSNSTQLVTKTLAAAKKINDDPELIKSFFKHEKLKI